MGPNSDSTDTTGKLPTLDKVVHGPEDVTTEWIVQALGVEGISSFEYERIGTGQMSQCYRFNLVYPSGCTGPRSVVLKVAANDPKSRNAGVSLGLYQREVLFYSDISKHLPNAIVHCYHTSFDEASQSFALLLADAGHMQAGDDISGATVEQASSCMEAMGQIHGHMLRAGVEKYPWLKREQPLSQGLFQTLHNGFIARYRDLLTVEHHNLISRLVNCYDAYIEQQAGRCVQGMIHGDFRLDNILFGAKSDELAVVDWQTVSWGSVLGDIAYFMGCALPTEQRRAHFDDLLKTYHAAVGPNTQLTLERCVEDLRNQSFFGIIMSVVASMMVEQTERGDIMFITMIKRSCDLVLDLKALEILPAPSVMKVLEPLPEDEYLHERGPEELFNESYYFDFIDQEQGVAGYLRLGITPNVAKGGWFLVVITRRGKPMVSIMDYSCLIPDGSLYLETDAYRVTHSVVDPLKNFKIDLKGHGQKYSDASSIFRGEAAEGNAEIALNLNFITEGTPYKYRITTRYEIPCLVDGDVVVDGERFTITKQVGQRDHSWGVRNWWNMDWLWSAVHFNDGERRLSTSSLCRLILSGTHIHIVDLYVQGQGQLGVGYYQKQSEVLEAGEINTKWDIDQKSNLVCGTKLYFTPQGKATMEMNAEVIGHGPLRLVSDEGKVAFFDRAWCRCTVNDGRVGYGWLEWNRVQS